MPLTMEEADQLALALLHAFSWASNGGKIKELPRIAQELSYALYTIGKNEQDAFLSAMAQRALNQTNGNIPKAAYLLGMHRTTLWRIVKNTNLTKYGPDRENN